MWKTVKLGDICTITNGSTPLRKEKRYWEEGNVPWFTIYDFRVQGKNITYTQQNVTQAAVDEKKVRLVPANSVLLCCTASIGEAAIARVEMATNQQFNALTPKSAALDSDYLYFVTTTLTQTLLSVSGSTTINFISMGKLKEISIPLPPLAEQQRIVAKLDAAFAEIDTAIAAAEKNAANAKAITKSGLGEIFENEADDWEIKKLSEVCIVERGSSPRPIKQYFTDDDGVNWIKIGDTEQDGKYVTSTRQKITVEGAKKSRHVNVGDFILTNSMSYGRPYIMGIEGYIHDGWFVLRLNKEINTEYFYYLLTSPYVQHQFHNLAAGAVVKNISGDLVKKTILPIPPLERQKEICERIVKIEEQTQQLEETYRLKFNNLNMLKSSLLAAELTNMSEAA
jgi:restriction endonuclease S subunit